MNFGVYWLKGSVRSVQANLSPATKECFGKRNTINSFGHRCACEFFQYKSTLLNRGEILHNFKLDCIFQDICRVRFKHIALPIA